MIVQVKSHFSMQLYKLIQNNITLLVCSVSELLLDLLQNHVLLADVEKWLVMHHIDINISEPFDGRGSG